LAFVTGGRSAHAPKKLDTGTKIEHKLRAKPRRDRSIEPAAETDKLILSDLGVVLQQDQKSVEDIHEWERDATTDQTARPTTEFRKISDLA
jgi:hypothetical protein